MSLQNAIRRAVIATSEVRGLGLFYRWIYERSAAVFALALRRAADERVRGVYLRRGLAGKEWRPGVSDIDFMAILDRSILDAGAVPLERIWRFVRRFRKYCPLLGEVQLTTLLDAEFFARAAGGRSREISSWRPMGGGSDVALAAPEDAGPIGRLREAAQAYLELCRTCLDAATAADLPPDFGFKIFKHTTDVFRFCRTGAAGGTKTRSEISRDLAPALPAVEREALGSPSTMSEAQALLLLRRALLEIEGASRFWSDKTKEGGALIMPPPSVPTTSSYGAGVWRRRLRRLYQSGIPAGADFCADGFQGWLLVLPEAPAPEAFQSSWERMRRWRCGDNAFSSPGFLVTRRFVDRLGFGLFAGTPFSRLAFPSAEAAETVSVTGYSRSRLWADRYRVVKIGSGPPGAQPSSEAIKIWMRQAAADFAVSWLMPWNAWDEAPGGNSGKLFGIMSRLLGIRLFLDLGRLVDPADVDAILGISRDAFPSLGAHLARIEGELLGLSESRLNALPPLQVFDTCRPLVEDTLAAIRRNDEGAFLNCSSGSARGS